MAELENTWDFDELLDYSEAKNADGIDGVLFTDLGLIVLGFKTLFNRANPQEAAFTQYGKEGYKITKTDSGIIELAAMIEESDYAAFQNRITVLMDVFSNSGLRYLTLNDDALCSFFVEDGFQITQMNVGDKVTAKFRIQLNYQHLEVINRTPTALRVTGITNTPEIQLAWNDKSTIETGYQLQRQDDEGAWVDLAALSANTDTYIDNENLT